MVDHIVSLLICSALPTEMTAGPIYETATFPAYFSITAWEAASMEAIHCLFSRVSLEGKEEVIGIMTDRSSASSK